ncbi:MAG: retroviral-like aspartic protease family protein [Chloroflexi bacterium]|nr:retroviral-like aspartic protease family protein [Chloroflexota bacterium]
MLTGVFDERGQPILKGRLIVPELNVDGRVKFRVDTGADRTSIHPRDARNLALPFHLLRNPVPLQGIGGAPTYYWQPAYLTFTGGSETFGYRLQVAVAAPIQSNATLPSLLGQDILRHWQMLHAPARSRLEFESFHADFTLMA